MIEICVEITNPMKVNERGILLSEWIGLPVNLEEFQTALKEIDAVEGEYIISGSNTQNFDIPIDPFTNLWELNDLVKRIEEVDEDEHYKLAALIELAAPSDFDSIHRIIDHLDEYDFLSEIQDDYALGRYFAIDCDMLHGTPEHLKYYFHFESFGFSMKLKHGIKYTSLGAIYRK